MKNIFKILILGVSIILIQSCDFVTFPMEGTNPGGPDTSNGAVLRKVLIDDFTGHSCTACPSAARTAAQISAANPGKVVIMGIHAGFFAKPTASYVEDFRTTAGDAYNTFFGITLYPSGMINRKHYPVSTTTYETPYGNWAAEAAVELLKPASAKIEISNAFVDATRALTCQVTTTFLYDTLTSGPYKLVVCLTQDSIIAKQLDQGVIVPNYVHQHVLRDNLNGTWGESISTVPVTKNSPIVKTYNYTLPATYPLTGGADATNCVPKHCEIVAILYNDVTKEVIQVESKHVVNH